MAKKETFWAKVLRLAKQRRLWAALSGAASLFCGIMGWLNIATTLGTLAGALGAWSYYKPK